MKPLLDALPALPSNGLRVVSLFAGGGLFDLGVIYAGFNVIWACEWEIAPTVAYASNIGDHIVGPRTKAQKKAGVGDITRIDIAEIPDCDVIIGGPPCQDYSVAGSGAGEDGERGQLVWRYLEIIEAKRPRAFMFENVKGLTTKKHRKTLDALLAKFDDIGYNVTWRVVNAWDYGVSQKRERVIIVGIRKDLDFTYEWPASEYEKSGYRPVLRDAIGDLPEPGVPLRDVEIAYLDRNPASVAKNRPVTMDEPSRTIPAVIGKGVPYGLFYANHEEKPLTASVYEHAKKKRIGYHPSYDEPAFTLRTKGEDVTEFPKPRRFTVREALRIQSVPDSYVIPTEVSLSAAYKIVGNGVASRMAYHLAAALASQLIAHSTHRNEVNTTDYANAA